MNDFRMEPNRIREAARKQVESPGFQNLTVKSLLSKAEKYNSELSKARTAQGRVNTKAGLAKKIENLKSQADPEYKSFETGSRNSKLPEKSK